MTTVSQEAREAEVTVTQADREAAASVAVLVEMRELILSGRADHHAEPFARHRAQAERETLARMEPVAWMYERKGFTPAVSMRDPRLRYSDIENLQPLYALPPAPEAGQ